MYSETVSKMSSLFKDYLYKMQNKLEVIIHLQWEFGWFFFNAVWASKNQVQCFCIKSQWRILKIKSKPTIPFLLHSEWDPPPQQQLFLIRLQSSAEYWYLHQTTNSQSQDDYDTNQPPFQVWNKEDIWDFF